MTARTKAAAARPTAALDAALLARLLKCAGSDAARPALHHLWVVGDDICATDAYVMVVHPGLGAGVPDGSIPRAAITFARQQHAAYMTVEKDTVTVAHPDGPVTFQRPVGTPPKFKELLAAMEFDGSHHVLNAELLLNVQQALGLHGVMLTRNKQQRKPLLVTRYSGHHDGEPYAVVMPMRSNNPGANE